MKTKLASLSIALSAAVMASGAYAGTIDLTDNGSYTAGPNQASGANGSTSWTLDPLPFGATLTYTSYDGNGTTGPLAYENDGIGVAFKDKVGDDDEVDTPEELVMTFNKAVSVVTIYVLDLFGKETVEVFDETNTLIGTVTAIANAGSNLNGGYSLLSFGAPVTVTSLTFRAGPLNDAVGPFGKPDFALAAVEIAAVPVPASGLLLVGAMAGLGALRRRKSA